MKKALLCMSAGLLIAGGTQAQDVKPANDIALITVSPQNGDPDGYGTTNSSINISGTVQNMGTTPITSYTVYVQEGDNAPVTTSVKADIAPLATSTFDNANFIVPSIGGHDLNIWVKINGDENPLNNTMGAHVQGVSFMPPKFPVFEEASGTWCGWCVRGSVTMRMLQTDYPNQVSLITVHNSDPMVVSAYDNLITNMPGFAGFPGVVVDRTQVSSINQSIATQLYNDFKDNFGYADLTMDAPAISGSNVTVTVHVKPAEDIAGAKLALVVTEDGVTGTGTGWGQHNYYAGGSSPMGGYENKPSVINDEVFDFVARSISPSPQGAASGLPATMTANSSYSATLTTTLDPTWSADSLNYYVLLIGSDGKILNSVFPGAEGAGVEDVSMGLKNVALYPNPATSSVAYISLYSEQNTNASVSITDMVGRSVYQGVSIKINAGDNILNVPTGSLPNGSYIVNVNTDKGSLSLKLDVVK